MINKPFKVVLHNDLDAGGSAICIVNHIKQKYGIHAKYELHFTTYKSVDAYVERLLDDPDKYEKLFIADIHIDPELANDVNKEFGNRWVLLDHHASCANLKGIPNCIIDLSGKMCAAAMCYKYLLKDQGLEYKHLNSLIKICNGYDLWLHNLPNNLCKNLNYIYYYYWGEKFVERFNMGFDGFTNEEKLYINAKWKEIEEQIKITKFIDVLENDPIYKNKFCVIPVSDNKDGEVNELCEHALKNLKYDVVMFINCKKRKISTRISENAAKKGLHIGNFHMDLKIGGGHEKAGGGQYFDETQLETICEAYTDKIINLNI